MRGLASLLQAGLCEGNKGTPVHSAEESQPCLSGGMQSAARREAGPADGDLAAAAPLILEHLGASAAYVSPGTSTILTSLSWEVPLVSAAI